MTLILYGADVISSAVPSLPFRGDSPSILDSPESVIPGSAGGDRHPIRHLLIGVPEAVYLTIHRLHQLGYAEAGLWSPAMGFPSRDVTLTVNEGDVMRLLRRSMQWSD